MALAKGGSPLVRNRAGIGRIPRRDFARNLQTGIIQGAGAEKNLIRGIVLPEEAFEMLGEIGLRSMQRLQQAHRRGERAVGDRAVSAEVKRLLPLP